MLNLKRKPLNRLSQQNQQNQQRLNLKRSKANVVSNLAP
ncbi:uroporphyrinogen-III synthetase domain protein, partial [Vibrio parahaemolyticus V-223/04]